jgi:hypothetical protein
MPGWLKVVLAMVAVGVIGLGVIVGGTVWFVGAHKDEIMGAAKETSAAGETFGRSHDAQGCLDEGLRRLAGVDGLTEEVKNNVWTSACLKVSRKTPGFCDGVPSTAEILGTVTWRKARCDAHAELDGQRCQRFMAVWQGECQRGGAR